MTVILGMSRLLRNEGLSPERVREVAVDIADSAEVLNGLIDSMLLLARLDQGEADLLREPILLHRAAEQVLAQQQARDPRRRYRFEDRSAGALVDAQGMWIERIISNFLGNAAKYSRPSGTVTVTVERQGGWGSVVVRDQGPKLPADAFEHVFEPFYRAPAARDRAPGAGLGLAVAKRLVELLQGRIWASPLPTGGAEFGFSLPLIRDEPA
jgi:two-component system sensor histidine kinase VicK